MGRTACTDPQCLYKGALYLCFFLLDIISQLYPVLVTDGIGNSNIEA